MRKSPTQNQLLGAFALLRAVLKSQADIGGNVTMTNVPIVGGTTVDIHVKQEGSPGISWWSIELDLGNGDPWRATGNTPQEAAKIIWWELCRDSEVFGEGECINKDN